MDLYFNFEVHLSLLLQENSNQYCVFVETSGDLKQYPESILPRTVNGFLSIFRRTNRLEVSSPLNEPETPRRIYLLCNDQPLHYQPVYVTTCRGGIETLFEKDADAVNKAVRQFARRMVRGKRVVLNRALPY